MQADKTVIVMNTEGIVFKVKIRKGKVFVFDHEHRQLVTTYHVDKFMSIPDGKALNLYGGEPFWFLDKGAVRDVKDAIRAA